MPEAQLVEDDAVVDIRAPESLRKDAGETEGTVGAGDGAISSGSAEDRGGPPVWLFDLAGDGEVKDQAGGSGPALGLVLGSRVPLDLDDPEGDPFALLEEEA